jgi:predicted secreted hydrolase
MLLFICIAPENLIGSANEKSEWRLALPGWTYEFPRDHFSHEGFKTEWWYFTGNLKAVDGRRRFGYQLTFFRQGITPGLVPGVRSSFATRDLSFAHFAVADLTGKSYRHFSRWSRGAFGEAGFSDSNTIAWIRDWKLSHGQPGEFFLQAEEEGVRVDLHLKARKDPVFHGADGVSQKAEGEGRASHYYTFTRLQTTGIVAFDGEEYEIDGWSWYDHEWATNQLTDKQTGWDWFSLQFEDMTELMLFQIRLRDGGRDPFSSGTWVADNGTATPVKVDDFIMEPVAWWTSPETKGKYPIEWKISIPKLDLELNVRAQLPDQEFREPPVIYWEGAIEATGSRDGKPVRAAGYLEMTGYAGEIVGMQEPTAVNPVGGTR